MLKRVHFAGIKSLLDVTVDLGPFTVLVGPNGCGKSTLLDMVELVVACARADRSSNNPLGSAGEALVAAGLDELRTAGRELAMLLDAEDGRHNRLAVTIAPGPWSAGLQVQGVGPDATVSLSFKEMGPLPAFAALTAGFQWRGQRLALVPSQVAKAAFVSVVSLDPSGLGLPTLLKDLAGNDTAAFLALQEDMRQVVPHFRELKFGKQDANGQPLVTLDLVMSQGRIPAHRASDGTLLALALLTATHNPDMPSLVLMDDLDHGLHLSAQIDMVQAIRRVMARRPELQVICTTHSPVLLDSFAVSEVRVMALDAQGYTRIKPLAEHPPLDGWREGMSTGELWANLGEDWVLNV